MAEEHEHAEPDRPHLVRVHQFTISTGELLAGGRFLVSTLDLAKQQDQLADEPGDRSYVLGWWDPASQMVVDGEVVGRFTEVKLLEHAKAVAEAKPKRSKANAVAEPKAKRSQKEPS